MQDLQKRNKADSVDPVVGETVYVNDYKCRGVVNHIYHEQGQTAYRIDMENGQVSRRLRREIVRVIQ